MQFLKQYLYFKNTSVIIKVELSISSHVVRGHESGGLIFHIFKIN